LNKIAVVVPVYNAETTIDRCVEKILAQRGNFEIVIFLVNDCSTDHTAEVLKKYNSFNNIGVVTLTKNCGPAFTRNIALDFLHDALDYVAFCDADDYWENPEHLTQLIAVREKSGYPGVIHCLVYCQDITGKPMMPCGIVFPVSVEDPELLRINNYIYISSTLVDYSIIKKVGFFDTELNGLEDWDYWIRCYKSGAHFYSHWRRNVIYTINPDGQAAKGSLIREKVYQKHKDFLKPRTWPTPLKLNLGCGDEIIPGFVNIDLYNSNADYKMDAYNLTAFDDNSVDYIRSHHVLEHCHFYDGFKVLKEWRRVLKPGGTLALETPDFLGLCRLFVNTDEAMRIRLYGGFFACPWVAGNAHLFLYTETQLKWTLDQCGFKNIQRVKPDSTYARAEPPLESIYLKITCEK